MCEQAKPSKKKGGKKPEASEEEFEHRKQEIYTRETVLGESTRKD
jgi:hypothetical protein